MNNKMNNRSTAPADPRHPLQESYDREIDTFGGEIRTLVDDDKWRQLETWCKSTTEMISLDTKARQMRKFETPASQTTPGTTT